MNKDIDRSLNVSELTLEVTARDDSSCCVPRSSVLTSTARVTVQIVGVNTQPVFPDCHDYHPSVLENAAVNTTVLEVCWAENVE